MKPLYLSYFSIAISVLALCGAFIALEFWWGVIFALAVGLSWVLLLGRKWAIGNTFSMLVMLLGISLVGIAGGARLFLLVSLLAALAAWDLAGFHNCLAGSENIANEAGLLRAHLMRLGSVLALGLSLPIITFAVQFELKFWQMLLMGAILLAGLSQVFKQLKRDSNENS